MAEDFKHILVGVDDSQDALAALEYAIHRAKADGAALTIASVLEEGDINVFEAMSKDYIHGEREDLEAHLCEYRDLAKKAGIQVVNTIIGEGDPGKVIVKQIVPQIQPDLLVVGAVAKTGLAKRFGSQAAYMAKHARISVLVIRD